MRHFVKILFVVVFCISSIAVQAKEIPMWEGLIKTTAQLAADKKFLRTMRELTKGKMQIAVQDALQKGWQFVGKNKPDMAIKRFNQAWLIAPDNPGVYWGFAIATDLQNVSLAIVERHFSTVEKYFRKAKNRLKMPDHDLRNAALHSDHGRVLEGRKKHKRAIIFFKKALSLDPDNRNAHVGMWMASKAIGDHGVAEKHKKLIK
ncbi:MAG: hypothetical protein QM488_16890 [Rhizobiaceae bacterium]